jgi:hypothetical protein
MGFRSKARTQTQKKITAASAAEKLAGKGRMIER